MVRFLVHHRPKNASYSIQSILSTKVVPKLYQSNIVLNTLFFNYIFSKCRSACSIMQYIWKSAIGWEHCFGRNTEYLLARKRFIAMVYFIFTLAIFRIGGLKDGITNMETVILLTVELIKITNQFGSWAQANQDQVKVCRQGDWPVGPQIMGRGRGTGQET